MAEPPKKTWTPAEIAGIASHLDLGMSVFVPVNGGEIYRLPREQDLLDADEDSYRFVIEAILERPNAYIQIDPPESREQYIWMRDFAEEKLKGRAQDRLLDTLSRKQPFAHFKDAVINMGIIKEWDAFTTSKYIEIVTEALKYHPFVQHAWLGKQEVGASNFTNHEEEE